MLRTTSVLKCSLFSVDQAVFKTPRFLFALILVDLEGTRGRRVRVLIPWKTILVDSSKQYQNMH